MAVEPLDAKDLELIEAARDVMRRNYVEDRYTVAAAVRTASGRVYVGVDVETTGYGPCAEPVAIGAAATHGEREFVSIVAVAGGDPGLPVLAPCGNCRQLLVDYAPDAMVILPQGDALVKARARDLLPLSYHRFRDAAGSPEPGAPVRAEIALAAAAPLGVSKTTAIDKMNRALDAAKRARDARIDVTAARAMLKEARSAFEAQRWAEAARISDDIIRQLESSHPSR